MRQYHDLVREVIKNGTRKENRTGVDTISKFNVNYEVDLNDGFPLLTTKKISWKNIVVENLWFLSGSKNIRLLKKHGCKFWDPWADEDGFVPSAYGYFWRNFNLNGEKIDQVDKVISALKENINSRRAVVSAWNPNNALSSGLPPCHMLWVLNIQYEKETGEPTLNLHLTQRSADIALGVPYNIAGYSLILMMLSKILDIKPGKFGHSIVDAHIYTSKADGSMAEYDHIPGLTEQLGREHKKLPVVKISDDIKTLEDIENCLELSTEELLEKFKLINYNPSPAIKFKVAV